MTAIIPRKAWGARHENGFRDAPLPAREVYLHHSVTIAPDLLPPFDDDDAAIRTLERIGEDRFGGGISYTWPITPVGRVYEGHSVGRQGAHTGGRNDIARAICFVGNYDVNRPTAQQLEAAAELLVQEWRAGHLTAPRITGGHRQAPGASTTCPGRYGMEAIPTINKRAAELAAGRPAHPIIGRIREAYDRVIVGRATWSYFLGAPLGPEVPTLDKVGRWQQFVNGAIYWHPDVDRGTAHVVWGDILKHWRAVGSETTTGYPVTDEVATPDSHGRYVHFAGTPDVGPVSIYWHPWTGAHLVKGAIRERWAELGWETGLGYPLTDELTTPDGRGRYNHFSGRPKVKDDGHTSIYWTPETGAHPVVGAFRAAWAAARWEAGAWGYPTSAEYRTADGHLVQDFTGGRVSAIDGRAVFTSAR